MKALRPGRLADPTGWGALLLSILAACSAPPPVDGGSLPDAGADGGPGDGGPADAGPGPADGGCVGESDAELCAGESDCVSLWAVDRCGRSRRVDCGGCATGGADGGPDGGPACERASCGEACGDFPDECGGVLHCVCPAPLACGAIEPERCGCVAATCAEAGRTCGELYDGCGRMLDCGPCAAGSAPPPLALRVAAANLTSGNLQSWDPGHGIRILQGLRPDVALVQEFNFGARTPEAIRDLVVEAFGPGFFHARGGGRIPNGVVSRYPIAASGAWRDARVEDRDFVWARVDLPGPRDLWVASVHLLTSNAGERSQEASALVALLRAAVPAADYLVVGGDLNTKSRSEGALRQLSGLVVTTAPHPADQRGADGTSADRAEPYDWVLADSDLDALRVPVAIGAASFPAGLVFDSRVYSPLSDVAPVLAGDSGAPNMQHMAVVKEFRIP